MSLPLLKPLLLTVGATSLVFFGGVIALSVQSPNADNVLSVENPITQPQSTQQSSLATLSAAQATALAKQESPNSILQATPELINYNGTAAYEVLLDSGATYIDANLGSILNPVSSSVVTSNYRAEGFDEDDDHDADKDKHRDDDKHADKYKADKYKADKYKADKYKADKHHSKKHDDKRYKESERLIATSYQQHDEDGFDEDSYDD